MTCCRSTRFGQVRNAAARVAGGAPVAGALGTINGQAIRTGGRSDTKSKLAAMGFVPRSNRQAGRRTAATADHRQSSP